MKQPLGTIAHTRSGDKGDTSNIGVIALKPEHYGTILREVTPERVKEFFGALVKGKVERFELPQILAPINSAAALKLLGGGGTVSLRIDTQNKTCKRGYSPHGD